MKFTITNTGKVELGVTIIACNELAFTVNMDTVTIPPGNDQDVEVTFTPTEGILYNGIIEITSNAVSSPHSVTVTGNGITGIVDELLSLMPTEFILCQNYPNPFNPTTSIIFGLPEASETKLTLFNSLGKEVANLFEGYINAGYHQVELDAAELASGANFYQLRAGSFIETKKMVLMK